MLSRDRVEDSFGIPAESMEPMVRHSGIMPGREKTDKESVESHAVGCMAL
jgi:hypothetical protein